MDVGPGSVLPSGRQHAISPDPPYVKTTPYPNM